MSARPRSLPIDPKRIIVIIVIIVVRDRIPDHRSFVRVYIICNDNGNNANTPATIVGELFSHVFPLKTRTMVDLIEPRARPRFLLAV